MADALTFCFGERNSRSKSLLAYVNDEVVLDFQQAHSSARVLLLASVGVELRVGTQRIIRVTRTVSVDARGNGFSEYFLEEEAYSRTVFGDIELEGGGQPEVPDVLSKPPTKAVARATVVTRLKGLGVHLAVADSFICTQQGSALSQLPGPSLLGVIEVLVGTAPLATAIDAQQV